MKKRIAIIILALLIAFGAFALIRTNHALPQVEANEIKVHIQFDLAEDIGLFLIDYELDGNCGSGGISNADRSMLKRDQNDLFWSLDKEHAGALGNTADITLKFTAVTRYFEPNYENIYPEAYMKPAGTLSFTGEFGKIYDITITGSQDDGYQAVLHEP